MTNKLRQRNITQVAQNTQPLIKIIHFWNIPGILFLALQYCLPFSFSFLFFPWSVLPAFKVQRTKNCGPTFSQTLEMSSLHLGSVPTRKSRDSLSPNTRQQMYATGTPNSLALFIHTAPTCMLTPASHHVSPTNKTITLINKQIYIKKQNTTKTRHSSGFPI